MKNRAKKIDWWGFLGGSIPFLSGLWKIVTGEGGDYWGVPVPYWVGWVFMPAGALWMIVSLRGRIVVEPRPYTEEDAQKAEAELDAMYLRDYGEPPEKHKRQK